MNCQRIIKLSLVCLGLVVVFMGLGCAAVPVRFEEGPKIVTLGIDARDYDEIAKPLYDSLTASPRVKRGKAVSLGPVDDDYCLYRFDARTLQEKLQTIALRSGLLEFNFAVDALTGNSAATERYRIMELQWTKESAVDPELLRTIGSLAKVDYILFGRVSAQTATKGQRTEVTYRYNWKLGDCESGLLVWADEMPLPKSGKTPPIPEWITDPRSDSPSYFYEFGSAQGGKTTETVRDSALANGRAKMADKLNTILGVASDGVVLPFVPEEIEIEVAPQGEFQQRERTGCSTTLLLRLARTRYAKTIQLKQEALNRWRRLENGGKLPDYRQWVADYPLGGQHLVQTEFALFRLASLERDRGNPCEARVWYEMVCDRSPRPDWKAKARRALENAPCSQEDKKRACWFKQFDGRTVRVACAYDLNGQVSHWDKLDKDIATLLSAYGAEVLGGDKGPPAASILRWTSDAEAGASFLREQGLDLLVILNAQGKINKKEDGYQFDGELRTAVVSRGDAKFTWNSTATYGPHNVSEPFFKNMLAVVEREQWEKAYLKHLGCAK